MFQNNTFRHLAVPLVTELAEKRQKIAYALWTSKPHGYFQKRHTSKLIREECIWSKDRLTHSSEKGRKIPSQVFP